MSRYEIKQIGVDDDYISYTSPSEVLGQLGKGDGLMQWGVNQAVDYVLDRFNTTSPLTATDINDSRTAWKQTRDDTADVGSELHYLIETHINKRMQGLKPPYFITLEVKLKQMYYQFLAWERKNVKRFIESEKPVLHRDLACAGTLDFVYEGYDGKIYCVDLKTSKTVYKEHEIQVVFYKHARESMYGKVYGDNHENDVFDFEMIPGKYKVKFKQDCKQWVKIFDYSLISIDHCAILRISRDYFDLQFKVVRDVEYKMKAYEALLTYFYTVSKRKLNNPRAVERR
jgi:hypothetical protein